MEYAFTFTVASWEYPLMCVWHTVFDSINQPGYLRPLFSRSRQGREIRKI